MRPHLSKYWKIPPDGNAAFVACMEDVLELYHAPYDARFPQVCMDESSKQLVGEVHEPIPVAPGRAKIEDHCDTTLVSFDFSVRLRFCGTPLLLGSLGPYCLMFPIFPMLLAATGFFVTLLAATVPAAAKDAPPTSLSPPLPPSEARTLRQQALALGASPTPPRLTLAQDHVARYRIHIGSKAPLLTRHAAWELARYLGQMSGGDFLPLSHDAHPQSGPLIVVGRDNALAAGLCPDVDLEDLGEDGFVIRTVGPHLVIAGRTPGGTMYGVNWFLDRILGVKWLSPDFTRVPAAETIQVKPLHETQRPRFSFRQVLSFEGQQKEFAAHNLLNGNSHGAFGHPSPPEIDHWNSSWQRPGLNGSYYQLLPPKEYQAGHPDWYAGGQMAMMDPEMRTAMAAQIVRRLELIPNYGGYWFGLTSNDWGWNMDPASAAFARAHGDAPSAPQVDMAVAVLGEVQKKLPDAKLAINAYHWSFPPPTGLEIPEDLLVFPMTIQVDYSSPLNKGRNVALGRDLVGWNQIAPKVLVWDHITNFGGFLQPTPNIYPLGESVQWLAGLDHVLGYFGEGSWNTPGAEFASLRVWLLGRLLWNPQTDVRAAVTEYCQAYFGPAGPFIKSSIDLMHAEARRTGAPVWEKTSVDSPLLNLDFLRKSDALLEEAEAAVADSPIFLDHVRQVRMGIDYVILLRRQELEARAKAEGIAWSAGTSARRLRFEKTVRTEGVKQYRQGAGMKELAALMDIERQPAPPPRRVRSLPDADWIEIQDLGLNRYGSATRIVADPAASDGAAIRLRGDTKIWGIQAKMYRVPEEGSWEIYAEVRVEAEGAAASDTALHIGSAPPRDRFTAIPYETVRGDGYHAIKVPGGPFRHNPDEQAASYIQSPDNGKIQSLFVDRFFLVRVAEPTTD